MSSTPPRTGQNARPTEPRAARSTRLTRHEKQAVRRFIRDRARHERRAYHDRGTAIGLRHLIHLANRRMRHGRNATILYPQDIGCGARSIDQILTERAL